MNLDAVFDRLKFGEDSFHELMQWRVRRVLLVLPRYDAWILEYDAKLSDQIVGEYHQLNLTTVPRLTTVSNGKEALEILREESFELMIIGTRVGNIHPEDLSREAKDICPDMAVLVLLSSRSDLSFLEGRISPQGIDAGFLWNGDSRLFLAMIKYVEDQRNAPEDVRDDRVGVLLVVEDSVSCYSAYLPIVYGEIVIQTQRLIAEEMNGKDKYWRMRTRPKVLLARDWEEAVSISETYKGNLIGIVSDISFPRGGKVDEDAGIALIMKLREEAKGIPLLLQSFDEHQAATAKKLGVRFQSKNSTDLQSGIRSFILEELDFGDFVFQTPEGKEIQRVQTLQEFEEALRVLPEEVVLFHAARNHYSRWMRAHGEYRAAHGIQRIQAEDFPDAESHRIFLVETLKEIRNARHRGRLVDFSFKEPLVSGAVGRYGEGSLGGKGRGLAFFNALLSSPLWEEEFAPLKIYVPGALIIATGEFDRFLENMDFPLSENDETLQKVFLETPLPAGLENVLKAFVKWESEPLAVRSSSLLEDSQSMPFAGVYNTYMISGGESPEQRLELLVQAVKLVWAGTFSEEACLYRKTLNVADDEEKMAVVIQKMVGDHHGGYFFPRLSGTAQSVNYYPISPMKREDGTARIAIGLGHSVVTGDRGFLFCPRYPEVSWEAEEKIWKGSQTHFWALEERTQSKNGDSVDLKRGEDSTLCRLSLKEAEQMGVLKHMVSTWDADGGRLQDGLDIPGPRVADFKDILHYDWLPLAPLLGTLLAASRRAMGTQVELEFAVKWEGDVPDKAELALLQVRPLIARIPGGGLDTRKSASSVLSGKKSLIHSSASLGDGVLEGIRNVIWVDPELYDSTDTEAIRDEVSDITEELASRGEKNILIGPGRWGSRDRFLGIPVSWAQVRQSCLIVEVALGKGDPEPSQGSHFFHNMITLGIGYAHIAPGGGFIDWSTLRRDSRPGGRVRLYHPEDSMSLFMNGEEGKLWVVKG